MRAAFDQIFGTVLGLGHIPVVPATWTSLAVALAIWAIGLDDPLAQSALLAVFVITGVPACGGLERRYGEDPRQATMDEAAGMTLSLIAVELTLVNVAVAFVLFRIFDVVKPFPARRFEDFGGGWGIMADDLMAGVYARAVLQIWVLLAPGLLPGVTS